MAQPSMPDPILQQAVEAALEKKARDPVLLDLRGLSDVTDYFLICHGSSTRQVQSIPNSIEDVLRSLKRRPKHIEGYRAGEWVLMDYLDLIVHIFIEEKRGFYALEKLWGDAPRLEIEQEPGGEEEARRSSSGGGSRKA